MCLLRNPLHNSNKSIPGKPSLVSSILWSANPRCSARNHLLWCWTLELKKRSRMCSQQHLKVVTTNLKTSCRQKSLMASLNGMTTFWCGTKCLMTPEKKLLWIWNRSVTWSLLCGFITARLPRRQQYRLTSVMAAADTTFGTKLTRNIKIMVPRCSLIAVYHIPGHLVLEATRLRKLSINSSGNLMTSSAKAPEQPSTSRTGRSRMKRRNSRIPSSSKNSKSLTALSGERIHFKRKKPLKTNTSGN